VGGGDGDHRHVRPQGGGAGGGDADCRMRVHQRAALVVDGANPLLGLLVVAAYRREHFARANDLARF
jgi:hypothetical protein